ncbi:phage terminase large subunit [Parasphingopyxis lamellibrachiae]|nr:phage terminase large subunit [Parasphingopyxis lamellibrachiae]
MEDPQALFTELCRHDFTAFLRKAWPWISGGELLQWNWHLDAVAHKLERVECGESRRSLINLPPRNGKSKTISVIWVAWMLGRNPALNFVCVSYSNELSGKMARDCRAIMEAPWYRELFPHTVISRSRSASHDFETTRGGGRLATSVTGTLTGRGGDIIILDDVIKPEEANSETTRNAVNDWFQSTLASRLNDKATGAILCVMQRLHQYDLSGMLLEKGGWDHLSLPAIATEDQSIILARGGVHYRRVGDVLHPAREPLEVLEELKASMGSLAFQAQYQQDPVPADGNLFKADWLKTYAADFAVDGYGEVVQSWDTAIKTGDSHDYSVCITARKRGKDLFIVDVWRGKLEFPDLRRKAIELARLHGAQTLIIEDKASGQQLIQALRAEDMAGVPSPIGRTPEADKYARAAGVSSMVEAGQVFMAADAHWVADFRQELLAFPNCRHDDQVDALAQLLDWARRRWMHEPAMIGAPIYFVADGYGHLHSSEDDDWEEFIG